MITIKKRGDNVIIWRKRCWSKEEVYEVTKENNIELNGDKLVVWDKVFEVSKVRVINDEVNNKRYVREWDKREAIDIE